MTLTRTETLVELLDLEPIELNIFRGISSQDRPTRSFGGLVAAQALTAAGRTVGSERPVHSLHAYFLLPGDATAPIVYVVDRIRDGRSFTTRRVSAVQHGKTIFHMSASFQAHQEGLEHQAAAIDITPPESVPTMQERFAPHMDTHGEWYRWFVDRHPVEVRYLEDPPLLLENDGPVPTRSDMWVRSRHPLPEDPLMHVCAATYASDLFLLTTTTLPHRHVHRRADLALASLDHAMWFHRPFRADDWLLYTQESPWAGGGRGLAHGQIFTREGVLVATVMQEGVIRVPRKAPEGSGPTASGPTASDQTATGTTPGPTTAATR